MSKLQAGVQALVMVEASLHGWELGRIAGVDEVVSPTSQGSPCAFCALMMAYGLQWPLLHGCLWLALGWSPRCTRDPAPQVATHPYPQPDSFCSLSPVCPDPTQKEWGMHPASLGSLDLKHTSFLGDSVWKAIWN